MMKRIPSSALLTVLALAALSGVAGARDSAAQTFPTDDPVIRLMWEEGMGDGSQAFDLSQALMDSIGPRLMGSPAFDAAGDWLLARYAEWGIEAEKQEYGTWTGWERGYSHIDLIAPRVRSLEGMMLAWSPGTDGPVEADVVLLPQVGSREEFDAWLPSVAGKAVAISFPEPTCREDQSWEDHATPETVERMRGSRDEARGAWFSGMRNLGGDFAQRIADAGAVALLTGRWSQGWGVDKIFSSPTRTVPGLHLSCEDYGLLARLAERGQSPRGADRRARGVPRRRPGLQCRGSDPRHGTSGRVRARQRAPRLVGRRLGRHGQRHRHDP